MPALQENLLTVRENVARAAERAGRQPGTVKLLAVSKTFPADDIAEAMKYGQIDFGENWIQELETKVPLFAGKCPAPRWHLIGHIQSNKAARAAVLSDCIHSIDSVKLIEKLDRVAEKEIDILLELNLSGEADKTGAVGGYDAFCRMAEAALKCDHLRLKGLMTMAAFDVPEVQIRKTFASLREIRDRGEDEFGISLPELSMGMSADYEYAIAEGATIVRIGTAIFGHRDYGIKA